MEGLARIPVSTPFPDFSICVNWANDVGTLVGVYATTNGVSDGETQTPAYVSRWRYHGQGQEVDYGVFVPSIPTP